MDKGNVWEIMLILLEPIPLPCVAMESITLNQCILLTNPERKKRNEKVNIYREKFLWFKHFFCGDDSSTLNMNLSYLRFQLIDTDIGFHH